MVKRKTITSAPKTKHHPPCPYPEKDCAESMAGLCCWECHQFLKCEMACKNKPSDFPYGCGKYEKGKKRYVE